MADAVQQFLTAYFGETGSKNGTEYVSLRNGNPAPRAILQDDVEAEVMDWTMQHLEQHRCPIELAPILARTVAQSVLDNVKLNNTANLESATLYLQSIQQLEALLKDISSGGGGSGGVVAQLSAKSPFGHRVSVSALKNTRRKMEDRHVVIPSLLTGENVPHLSYYGVFDGHAGSDAANFAATHYHFELAAHPHLITDTPTAIKDAFLSTDELFRQRCAEPSRACGSTAVVCVVRENKTLYVGWLGDSQVVVSRNGGESVLEPVNPHRADRSDEQERVRNAGGTVVHVGSWRVNGMIVVSRSLGDFAHKPALSAEADTATIELDGSEDFMVIGSDGLFDHLSAPEICTMVYQSASNAPDRIDESAHFLANVAKQSGSKDNITCVVVYFRNPTALEIHPTLVQAMEQIPERTAVSELPTPPVDTVFDNGGSPFCGTDNDHVVPATPTKSNGVSAAHFGDNQVIPPSPGFDNGTGVAAADLESVTEVASQIVSNTIDAALTHVTDDREAVAENNVRSDELLLNNAHPTTAPPPPDTTTTSLLDDGASSPFGVDQLNVDAPVFVPQGFAPNVEATNEQAEHQVTVDPMIPPPSSSSPAPFQENNVVADAEISSSTEAKTAESPSSEEGIVYEIDTKQHFAQVQMSAEVVEVNPLSSSSQGPTPSVSEEELNSMIIHDDQPHFVPSLSNIIQDQNIHPISEEAEECEDQREEVIPCPIIPDAGHVTGAVSPNVHQLVLDAQKVHVESTDLMSPAPYSEFIQHEASNTEPESITQILQELNNIANNEELTGVSDGSFIPSEQSMETKQIESDIVDACVAQETTAIPPVDIVEKEPQQLQETTVISPMDIVEKDPQQLQEDEVVAPLQLDLTQPQDTTLQEVQPVCTDVTQDIFSAVDQSAVSQGEFEQLHDAVTFEQPFVEFTETIVKQTLPGTTVANSDPAVAYSEELIETPVPHPNEVVLLPNEQSVELTEVQPEAASEPFSVETLEQQTAADIISSIPSQPTDTVSILEPQHDASFGAESPKQNPPPESTPVEGDLLQGSEGLNIQSLSNLQNTLEKLNIMDSKDDVAATTEATQVEAIPESVPEAEGVMEDSDSEKDGGWKYVKPEEESSVSGAAVAAAAATAAVAAAGVVVAAQDKNAKAKKSSALSSPAKTSTLSKKAPAAVAKVAPLKKAPVAAATAPAAKTGTVATSRIAATTKKAPAATTTTTSTIKKAPASTTAKPATTASRPPASKPAPLASKPAATAAPKASPTPKTSVSKVATLTKTTATASTAATKPTSKPLSIVAPQVKPSAPKPAAASKPATAAARPPAASRVATTARTGTTKPAAAKPATGATTKTTATAASRPTSASSKASTSATAKVATKPVASTTATAVPTSDAAKRVAAARAAAAANRKPPAKSAPITHKGASGDKKMANGSVPRGIGGGKGTANGAVNGHAETAAAKEETLLNGHSATEQQSDTHPPVINSVESSDGITS